MERQTGLGKSLEQVLDSLPPVEPTDQAPTHALFGIAPEDAAVANGTSDATEETSTTKSEKKNKKNKNKKSGDEKNKNKNKNKKKKKKIKGKGKQRAD